MRKLHKIRFCHKCHANISSKGEFALSVFLDICSRYLLNNPAIISGGPKGNGDVIMHMLERDGYIISTEFDDHSLILKPAGHKMLEDEINYFCGKELEHKKTLSADA